MQAPQFAGAMEHNDKFHHWHQGKDAGVAIQVEDPKLFWCRAEGSGRGGSLDRLAMRQVWDGGEIVANVDLEDSVKQVRANSETLFLCRCSISAALYPLRA